MITDLANLRPSLRTSDLGANKSKDSQSVLDLSRKPESNAKSVDSFDQTLQTKLAKPEKALQAAKPEATESRQETDRPVDNRQENRPRMATEKKSTESPVDKSAESADDTESTENESSEEATEPVREKGKSKGLKEAKESKGSKELKDKKAPSDEKAAREKVMLQFMDSIESELGIPPQRMLEAMTNLTDADAESSPEDSASQVIAQLQLPPDQAQKAYQMYTQMLGDLSRLPKQPEPKTQVLAAATLAPAAAVAMKERKELLNNSLDRMNSSFFMRQELAQSGSKLGPDAEMSKLPNDMMPSDRMQMGNSEALAYKASLANQANGPMRPLPEAMTPATPEAVGGMSGENSSESMKKLAEKLAILGATAGALDKSIKTDPQNVQALKAEAWLKGQGMQNPTAGAAAISAMAAANAHLDSDDDNSGDMEGQSSADQLMGMGHHLHNTDSAQPTFAGAMAGAGAATAGAKTQEGDNQANMSQIMQQAKFMIKKGGGESVIKMSPEGLGNLHMKVIVQEGKVSVEMATENNEAKKMIESSIGDLKHSLGAHKLSIDSIKVDVGSQLADKGADHNSQNHMNSHADQGRDQARQFMSQFQEENMGRRDGAFWDSPGLRAYSSERKTEPLKPAEPSETAKSRYAGARKGSGLDLVA